MSLAPTIMDVYRGYGGRDSTQGGRRLPGWVLARGFDFALFAATDMIVCPRIQK